MNQNTQAPPPSYQPPKENYSQAQYGNAGQTYYEPPPQNQGYVPPPPTTEQQPMGQRFVQFYAPPENRKLGLIRKCTTLLCCCIIIGLIVGLAAGLTSRNNYSHSGSRRCNCRTNSDCVYTYGSGTYCYGGCQCAYR